MNLVQDHELSLVGTLMYQKADYEHAVELIAGGQMVLGPIITDRFAFADYLQAYQAIEEAKGNTLKVMISLD